MPAEFPQSHVAALQELAVRLIASRKARADLGPLARDLLGGFVDVCTRAGLDRILVELGASDSSPLEDREDLLAALATQLEAIKLDSGGPRGAKPRQLVDCIIAALALTIIDAPDRSISLGEDV